jgi:isoleucyl-tRNA synthetase
LVVAGSSVEELAEFAELIADEVNVKQVLFVPDASKYASANLTVVFKVAAPRLGPATQQCAAAARNGDWELLSGDDEGRARVGTSVLEPDEFEMKVTPVDERTTRPLPGNAGVIVVDVDVTEVLELEGRARDLIRVLQQERREQGLDVTDRIVVTVAPSGGTDPEVVAALVDAHGGMIMEQVLAVELSRAGTADSDGSRVVELADGTTVAFRIERAG